VGQSPIDNPSDAISSLIAEVEVDRKAEVPIGIQLAWAIRSRIGDGRLATGDRLPGLRELAESTGVNVNTVRAVYQRLEQKGLITSQQGSGTFVGPTAPRPTAANQIAASAANEAREVGVDPREVAAVLYICPEETATVVDEPLERRRLLRAQIGALERTVGELEALHPGLLPPPAATTARAGGPALLGSEALEGVRTELIRRLAAIQVALDGRTQPDTETARAPAPVKTLAKAKARTPAKAQRSDAAKPAGKSRAPAKRRAKAPPTRPVPAGT
jgi:DNA-binding transcriptional regulator YhcF (GntR family)